MTTSDNVAPAIRVQNHTLSLPPASGLPLCLLQIILLPSQTMLWLGSAVSGQSKLGTDWSVAMPGFGTNPTPTSTSLSRTTNGDITLSMSKRLSRRFKQPIFLSIDLPFLNSDATGVSVETSGKWTLLLEKMIVQKLEAALSGEDGDETLEQRAERLDLAGEMVGR